MSDRSPSRSPSPRHKDYSTGRRRRSYSRSASPRDSRRRRRSRSRSYSPRNGGGYSRRDYGYSRRSGGGVKSYGSDGRQRSRSPMSNRRRHVGNREEPEPGNCIGVFGLSLNTREQELRDVFENYGHVNSVNIVYDKQSGRSRGFCFVYFREIESAKQAKEQCDGIDIGGRKIRVDFSITERAHTPTPGIYLGRPTSRRNYSSRYDRDRSPSPYGGGGYSRSRYRTRSRSFSPKTTREVK